MAKSVYEKSCFYIYQGASNPSGALFKELAFKNLRSIMVMQWYEWSGGGQLCSPPPFFTVLYNLEIAFLNHTNVEV